MYRKRQIKMMSFVFQRRGACFGDPLQEPTTPLHIRSNKRSLHRAAEKQKEICAIGLSIHMPPRGAYEPALQTSAAAPVVDNSFIAGGKSLTSFPV